MSLYVTPTIRGYNQKRLYDSTVARFLSNVVSSYGCTSCGGEFVPLFSMGKRECRVHPQPCNSGFESSSARQIQRCEYPSRTLPNHFACCGGSQRPADRMDYDHDQSMFARGCCPADHVNTTRWRDTTTSGFLGHEDLLQAFHTQASTSSHSRGGRLSMLTTPVPVIFASAALASRIQIWPLRVIERLYEMRITRAESLFAAGAYALPFRLSGAAYAGGMKASVEEKVAEVLGDEALLFGEGRKEQVLRPTRRERLVALNVGTQRVIIDLRDAYISMAQAFNLPIERLAQQVIRDTGTRTTVADGLAREREMQARFRLQGGDLLAPTQARQILFDPEVLRMRHQELQAYTDTFLQQQAQASVAGEAGVYDDPEIHAFMMDIQPFVVTSWIDPFVAPAQDDPMRGLSIVGDPGY
jgi:hypothetical protein